MRALRWNSPALLLLLLLLLVLALPVALLFTSYGSRLLVAVLPRIAPVAIDYAGGTLAQGLELDRLGLAVAGTRIELEDVSLVVDPGCFWNSTVCLRDLRARFLHIALEPAIQGQAKPAAGGQNHRLWHFPFALRLDNALLDGMRVSWDGGSWQQDALRLDARLRDSRILVTRAQADNALLVIAATGEREPRDIVLPQLFLPLKLQVEDLTLLRPRLQLGEALHTLQRVQLEGRWSRRQLRLAHLAVDAGSDGRFSLADSDIVFSGNWPLRGSAVVHTGSTAPWQQFHDREMRVELGGDAANLALHLSAPGTPALDGHIRLDLLAPGLPFTADVALTRVEDLELPMPDSLPPGIAVTSLQSPLRIAATGTTSDQHATLSGRAGTAGYGDLDFTLALRHGGSRVLVEKVELRDGDNQFSADGEVVLAPDIRWTLHCSSSGLDIAPLWPQLPGRLAGSFATRGALAADGWNVALEQVDLQGAINDTRAQVSGNIALRDGAVQPGSRLQATANNALLVLEPAGDGSDASRLSLAVDNLGDWQPGSAGSLELTARVASGAGQYELTGTASRLRWQGVYAAAARLSASVSTAAAGSFHASADFDEPSLDGITLTTLSLRASGDQRRQRLELSSDGDVQGQLVVSGSGDRDDWAGTLSPTALRALGLDWTLAEPIPLTWSGGTGQLRIGAHCWRQAALQICPGEWLAGREGGGELAAGGELSVLDALLPGGSQLRGTFEATAQARWNAGDGLTAQGQLATGPLLLSRELAAGERGETRWQQLRIDASLGGDGLRARADLLRQDRPELQLAIHRPGSAGGNLEGRLHLDDFSLEPLSGLAPSLADLAGRVNGDLSLGGTVNSPQILGSLQLTDGRLQLTGNPTALTDLNLRLDARGDTANLEGDGTLGGGTLNLEGALQMQPELLLALQLQGREHNLVYPPSLELLVSETVNVTLTRARLSIDGDVTVHDGKFLFEQLPEGGVDVSADVVRVDNAPDPLPETLPLQVTTELGVRIEDGFTITGKLLDSSLSGDLRLRGQTGQPLQLFGSLDTAGGFVRAYDRLLVIKQGVISFNGNPANPLVDLRAERKISGSNIVAGLHVFGALEDRLSLEVYSDPAMSPGEAMSYLIWGRGLQTSNTGDGAVVALSLASSVVNRSSLVETVNRIPGISDVSFGAEGSEEDAAATVSGYIGERIYLSYGYGIYQPISLVTARLFLQTRLWLEVVSQLENSLDLYYSFDID